LSNLHVPRARHATRGGCDRSVPIQSASACAPGRLPPGPRTRQDWRSSNRRWEHFTFYVLSLALYLW